MRTRVIPLASAILVAACSAASGSAPPATSTAAPPSPETSPPASASHVADVVVGGDRPVTVHVPPGYDPSQSAPLLIVLHGYSSDGSGHEAYFGLGPLADERGFVSVYPDGTRDSGGDRFWNATDACCDFDRTGIDDAAWLDQVITEIEAKLKIDPKRIGIAGHSNGGFMSYQYACTHGDRVAAIVSLAGATFAKPADCAPAAPVAVLQIHGAADDVVTFDGGTLGIVSGRPMAPYPGARTTAETWGRYDGCDEAPVMTTERVDIDADLGSVSDPNETTVERWSGCKPGGAVELWTMPDGGHVPNISNAFPGAVLDFLAAHPKP